MSEKLSSGTKNPKQTNKQTNENQIIINNQSTCKTYVKMRLIYVNIRVNLCVHVLICDTTKL